MKKSTSKSKNSGKYRKRPTVGATADKARKQGYKNGDVIPTFGHPKMNGTCRMFLHKAGCKNESACRFRHVVRPMSSAKVPCRDFQNGFCAWGDKCLLDHVAKEDKRQERICPKVNQIRTKERVRTKVNQICGQFDRWGTCDYGDSCIYVHKRTKVDKPCNAFQRGECEYGDACKFQHVIVKSKKICREFEFTGVCSRHQCGYTHVRAMKTCEPCGRHLSKEGCPFGLECKFHHVDLQNICRVYNSNGNRKCRQGTGCSMAHIKLVNGRIERFERTAGFLSEQKPMVRFFSNSGGSSTAPTMRCSRTPTTNRSRAPSVRSQAPSVMSVKTDMSASLVSERRQSWAPVKQRLSETNRVAEQLAQAETQRIAEQQRLHAEAQAEAQRIAEEQRLVHAEAQRLAEQQRLHAEAQAEAQRVAEQERLHAEAQAEAQRLARAAEAQRIAEAERAIAKIEAQRAAAREVQRLAQEAARLAEVAERQRLTQAIASARARLQSAQFRCWAASDRLVAKQSTVELEELYKELSVQASAAEQQAQLVESKANLPEF